MTRKVKISLIAIFMFAGILVGLTGCGKIGQRYVDIEWTTSYFEKYYVRWFEDFEKLHADEHVRIRFRAIPTNPTQAVYTMLISHTLSDVIAVGDEIAGLLFENKALEVVPEDTVDLNDYMPVAVSWPRYPDGTLAAIPSGVGMRPYIYFDSADFREAGTSLDEIPTEFGPYMKWAEKLFKRRVEGEVVVGPLPEDKAAHAEILRRPLGITRGHLPSFYPFMCAFFDPMPDGDKPSDNSLDDFVGGPPNRPFRFDSPEFADGLRRWQSFFVPTETAIADGNTERLLGLQNDTYAGCEAGNWIFGEVFTINMLVSALPHPEGRPLRLYCGPGAEGISRESKHKELAFEWAKYITAKDQQVDGYYGHGYTPGRLSAWQQLHEDDIEDQKVRKELLGPFTQGNGDYVGQPQINRTSHDSMDVLVFVAADINAPLVTAYSWQEQEALGVVGEAASAEGGMTAQLQTLAQTHMADAKKLADAVGAMTGERVTAIVQGTPAELLALRSNIHVSPIPAYLPHLKNGVFSPNMTIWNRIATEVLASAIQKVAKADKPESPEAVAKWCQEEATAIVAGKK